MFRSLWHLCLYGVGQLESEWVYGNKFDNLWLSAAGELKNRFHARSPANVVNLKSIQDGTDFSSTAFNEALRYFYYFPSASDTLESLCEVIRFHMHHILKWSDRCKYELLATCSMFANSKKIGAIELISRSKFIADLTIILLSIKDPFLYARLANLLFVDLGKLSGLRAKEEISAQSLNKIFDKFQKNMHLMSLKQPDEAHSISAFYVFSACLLGDTIARIEEGGVNESTRINILKKVADEHFTLLAVDHKASQYTFYRMFLANFDNNYETELICDFSILSKDYANGDFANSPLAYLRSSYLLMEHSRLQGNGADSILEELTNQIITRLTKISSSHLAVKDKYDNDILCFCYAYILSCLDSNSELRRHVLAAGELISNSIKSAPSSDLYKLLNCRIAVKHS